MSRSCHAIDSISSILLKIQHLLVDLEYFVQAIDMIPLTMQTIRITRTGQETLFLQQMLTNLFLIMHLITLTMVRPSMPQWILLLEEIIHLDNLRPSTPS